MVPRSVIFFFFFFGGRPRSQNCFNSEIFPTYGIFCTAALVKNNPYMHNSTYDAVYIAYRDHLTYRVGPHSIISVHKMVSYIIVHMTL